MVMCGLDCFHCAAHEANVTPEYRGRVAALFGVAPQLTGCGGCRAMPRHCLRAHGLYATYACAEREGVAYCFECDRFPCGRLAPSIGSACREYPHNYKLCNLCRMKAVGVERWIGNEADGIRDMYYNGRFMVGDERAKP